MKTTPQMVKHSIVIDHQKQAGIKGLITIQGVKYTTAPAIAVDVERLLKSKNILPGTSRAAHLNVTEWRSLNPSEQQLHVSFGQRFPHLERIYGLDCIDIFKIMAENASSENYLRISPPLLEAEVLYFIRTEMAERLSDIVLRRSSSGTTGCPTNLELEKMAAIMAVEKDWSPTMVQSEIHSVLSYYRNTLGLRRPDAMQGTTS